MPIEFRCPCTKKFRVADAMAGKRTKCLSCGQSLTVPSNTHDDFEVIEDEVVEAEHVQDEVITAVALDEAKPVKTGKKKNGKKLSKKEKQDKIDRLNAEIGLASDSKYAGKNEPDEAGWTFFGIHITGAVISGTVMLLLGITMMVLIKANHELGESVGPRGFMAAIGCTVLGGLLLIKAFVFGSED